jgi:hypothetical protein
MIISDTYYLYALTDPFKDKAGDDFTDSGLYCYDLMSMTNRKGAKIERYKISEALGGETAQIDFNADL